MKNGNRKTKQNAMYKGISLTKQKKIVAKRNLNPAYVENDHKSEKTVFKAEGMKNSSKKMG